MPNSFSTSIIFAFSFILLNAAQSVVGDRRPEIIGKVFKELTSNQVGISRGVNERLESKSNEVSRTFPDSLMESSTVGMLNRWQEGINPYTDEPECCLGYDGTDCSANCSMTPTCDLPCGTLILPESDPQKTLTTQLTAALGGKIRLAVEVVDLRPGDSIAVSYQKDGEPLDTITCDSFTNDEAKYFVSEDASLFVSYTYTAVALGLGCGGYESPTGMLKFETLKLVECDVDIPKDEDGSFFGDIVSPGFPYDPYPSLRNCVWNIHAPSPGYGIELQVKEFDLDGFYEDHLQVYAGEGNENSRGYIMTWTNTKSQLSFKVFPGGSAKIIFQSGLHLSPNEHKGFHIVYKHFGNGSVPESTTTMGPPLPTASPGQSTNYTIYIAGKTPEMVNDGKDDFRGLLVPMANQFCQDENITLSEPVSLQDVFIHSIMYCPATWPYSHKCAEVIIQIAAKTMTGEYELTATHLGKMWGRYGMNGNITSSGIRPYTKDPEVITWWLVAVLATILLFGSFLALTWYLQKKPHSSSQVKKAKKPSSGSEKRSEMKGFDYPNPPFSTHVEDDEDDVNSYTYDHRDSCYDYDGTPGSLTYSSTNDGIGLYTSGGSMNHAYNHDDDDMDEIDLGRDDFQFEFTQPNSRLKRNQLYEFPAQQKIHHLEMNSAGQDSETAL